MLLWDHGQWTPVGDAGGRLPARQAQVRAARARSCAAAGRWRGWAAGRAEGGKNWLLLKERDVGGAPRDRRATSSPSDRRASPRSRLRARCPSTSRAAARDPRRRAARRATTGCTRSSTTATAPSAGSRTGERGSSRAAARTGASASGRWHGRALACPSSRRGWTARSSCSTATGAPASRACSRRSARRRRQATCATSCSISCTSTAPTCVPCRWSNASSVSRRWSAASRTTRVRYGDHVVGRGEAFLDQARAYGLEGIVSKRRDAPHRDGRHADWRKMRCHERGEFVVGGFTDPGGLARRLRRPAAGRERGRAADHVRRTSRDRVLGGDGSASSTAAWPRSRMRRRPSRRSRTSPPGRTGCAPSWSRGHLHQLDARRAAAPSGVRRPARRQAGERGRPGAAARDRRPRDAPTRRSSWKACVSRIRIASLWPEVGVTKLELARYYVAIADWILPARRRPPARRRARAARPRGHDLLPEAPGSGHAGGDPQRPAWRTRRA